MNQEFDRATRIILLFIVILFLLVSTIIYINVYGFNIELILVSGLMILLTVVAILLYKSHPLLALSTGLFSFVISVVLQYLITEKYLVWNTRLGIVLVLCFLYAIYEEIKLLGKPDKSKKGYF